MTPGSGVSRQSFRTGVSSSSTFDQSSLIHSTYSATDTSISTPATPDDDPTLTYVQLKMQISDLTVYRKPNETADVAFLRQLQQRLEEVKQDYLFDEREAETAYRAERKKVDDAALQSRLRGETVASPPKTPRIKSPPKVVVSQSSTEVSSIAKTDIFDDDDNEGDGGIFQLLEEMPQTDTTMEGVTIQIYDMPLPRNWSGKTPRTLLLEVVTKSDKHANVAFRSISGDSRAKRAEVRIIWSNGKTSEWSMDNVACYDNGQAEQYIATVALHGISFPPTDGFAVGGAASTNNTSFRLLPAVYRDLWTELERKRRSEHDVINRKIWGKLRNILELKLAGTKVCCTLPCLNGY